MNIILGKLGGVGTSFGIGYKEYGGDIIANLFLDMAKHHPENNYYLSTANDISKVFTGFNAAKKPRNLIDYYERQKTWLKDTGRKGLTGDSYKMLDECVKLDNIKVDKVIVLAASCANATLWDLTYTFDGTRFRSPLATCRNGSQIVYYVSIHPEVEFDWILDDPRIFLTYPVDLVKCPDNVASQANETVDVKVCSGYLEASKTMKTNTIVCKYSHLEKYFLKGKKKVDWRGDKRSNKFIMTLHGLPDRAKLFKKWIYDFDPTIKAYGKNWSENAACRGTVEKLGIPFENFENKPILEMEDMMWDSKYTFIPPVSLKYRSFVTQKVWTMLYYGIVPFWCKDDYDVTNIYSDIPAFLKVETPQEMWDKIKFLEDNPEEYEKIRDSLFEVLKDEYFDTDFVFNEIEKVLDNKS